MFYTQLHTLPRKHKTALATLAVLDLILRTSLLSCFVLFTFAPSPHCGDIFSLGGVVWLHLVTMTTTTATDVPSV